jgi:hypothetical protein
MTYDRNERMNAEQKEGAHTADAGAEQRYANAADTEFASETWMGAVMNPEAAAPRGNFNYDPDTYTERYVGENGLSNDTDLPDRELTDEADDRGKKRPVRSIVGDDVETSAEIAEPIHRAPRSPVTEADREDAAGGLGMVGLGLSILSLFLLPYIVAPIGMVLGYLAFRRNARTLGAWAMIVGAVAILGALVIYPYYVAR